jgi:hypothetical protein
MSTITKDVGRFRLSFAIGAAKFAVFLGMAAATWMGALLRSFHAMDRAFQVPLKAGCNPF